MRNTWFTADPHFCHDRMAKGRGFKDAYEMEEHIIHQWNACVKGGDYVYILGDFGYKHKRLTEIRNRLKGKLHLIVGNHDIKNRINKQDWFTSIHELITIKIDKLPIVLCHYPLHTWDRSHYNSFHFYGHVHTGLNSPSSHYSQNRGKCIDVGMDNNSMKLFSYDQLVHIMDKQPDNFNLVRR